jgi:hypothetical protein
MSFDAKVLRVFIASPSDMTRERDTAADAIYEWNTQHSLVESIILMPIRWETSSWPQAGARPQEIINKRLVRDCDILIGMFWTKIGTKTGGADSGTVEEIDQFVSAGKPTLLYFSRIPIDPNLIDLKQHKKLCLFKAQTSKVALFGTFGDLAELHQILLRDLTFQVQELIARKTPGARSRIGGSAQRQRARR